MNGIDWVILKDKKNWLTISVHRLLYKIKGDNKMKKTIFTVCVLFSSLSFAQDGFLPSDIGYNLDRLVSSQLVSPDPEAARINAQADLVYKTSLANINNEKAYGLALNNQVLRASAHFEKRQINLYNRTLLDFQKKQITEMRRYKNYSKEDLDQLFDIRYKTGYIIP
jgi:hypothetical protein